MQSLYHDLGAVSLQASSASAWDIMLKGKGVQDVKPSYKMREYTFYHSPATNICFFLPIAADIVESAKKWIVCRSDEHCMISLILYAF